MTTDSASLYSTLPSSTSIRLLCLNPGNHEEPVSCSLVVVQDFPPSAEYIALSYCWGDANDTTTLSCDGMLVPVTKTLNAALQHLREKTNSRLVWADAICINQQDILERNQQIMIMRQIYFGASSVYIWVGHGDSSSRLALNLVKSIGHACCRTIYGPDSSPSSCLGRLCEEQDRTQVVMNTRLTDLVTLRDISPEVWYLVWQFFQREWFFRVWVIQEVRACPNTWLLCGENMIEWDLVVLAANWIRHFPNRDNKVDWRRHHFPSYGGFHNAFFMWDRSLRIRREAPFPALLSIVRSFRATDPRDKVFAMLQYSFDSLGKIDSGNPPSSVGNASSNHLSIHADYNMDTREAYRQVAVKSIHIYHNLEVLCYAWQTAHIDLSWSSWIPRWDIDTHGFAPGFAPLLPFLYNAAQGIPPSSCVQEDTLVVQGFNLGHITETDTVLRFQDKQDKQEFADLLDGIDHVRGSLMILSKILVQDQWQDVPGGEITAERASKHSQILFADFCAYLLPRLEDHRRDCYFPVNGRFCSECIAVIQESKIPALRLSEHFTCAICANGEYDLCANCYGQGKRCNDPKHSLIRRVATSFWCPYADQIINQLKAHASSGDGERFYSLCRYACSSRLFLRVFKEWRGVGPLTVEAGDIVVVLFGSRVPFVLRQQGDAYRLAGDCYIHGFMDGEAIQMWKDGQMRVEEFKIR